MDVRACDQDPEPVIFGPLSVELEVARVWNLARPTAAVVCPDDLYLSGSSAAASGIRLAADSKTVDDRAAELAGWPDPVPKLGTGDAVLTPAGSLRAKCIIHAVALDSWGRIHAPSYLVAIGRALDLCEELHLDSLAIPAAGTESDPVLEEWSVGLGHVLQRASRRASAPLKRIVIAVQRDEDASFVRQSLVETLATAEQREAGAKRAVEILSTCLAPSDAEIVALAWSEQGSHEDVFQALRALVLWMAEVVEAEERRQGGTSRIPDTATTEALVEWTVTQAGSLRAPVVREVIGAIASTDDEGAGGWLNVVPAIEASLVREATVPRARQALVRGKEVLAGLVTALAAAEGFHREAGPVPLLRHADGREIALRMPVAARKRGSLAPPGAAPPTERPAQKEPSTRPTEPADEPTLPPAERAGTLMVSIPPPPSIPSLIQPQPAPVSIVEPLAAILDEHLKGDQRAQIAELCKRLGYRGDHATQTRQLCSEKEPLWILREYMHREQLLRALMRTGSKKRGLLDGKPLEELASCLLDNLGFPAPPRPEGLNTFTGVIQSHERHLKSATDLDELVGAVMGAARALDRICADLLLFHTMVLFGAPWMDELKKLGFIAPDRRPGSLTLGTLVACLKNIDTYLASGDAPDIVVERWTRWLNRHSILGKVADRLQTFVAMRNWVAHPREGQFLRDLSADALRAQGIELFSEVLNPLLGHLREADVYPVVIAAHRIETDAFGRCKVHATDDAGMRETIMTQERVRFGCTYFMASITPPPLRIDPLLMPQHVGKAGD